MAVDAERVLRMMRLDARALMRFLPAVIGQRGQHYWGEIGSTLRGSQGVTFEVEIPFYRTDSVSRMDVYDDLGQWVGSGEFSCTYSPTSGDRLRVTYQINWEPVR